MLAVINTDGQRPKKDVLMFIQSGRSIHLVNVPLVTDQSICYNNTSLSLSSKSSLSSSIMIFVLVTSQGHDLQRKGTFQPPPHLLSK